MRVRGADDAQACVLPADLVGTGMTLFPDNFSETCQVTWLYTGTAPARWQITFRDPERGFSQTVQVSGVTPDYTFNVPGFTDSDYVEAEALAQDSCGRWRPIGCAFAGTTE